MALTSSQLVTLRALIDRLIPADDFPGALAAGTDAYISNYLGHAPPGTVQTLLEGLTCLDAEAVARHGPGVTFSALSADNQDTLLAALELNRSATPWPTALPARAFFHRFVDLAHEGFYADPANGGNRSALSWQMLGYDPRLP